MQKKKTSIGGSALIEGIMMRGPSKMAIAVRKPDGEIELDVSDIKSKNSIFRKIPIIRGMVSFWDSMVTSMKALMYSAEFVDVEADEEETSSRLEKWLTEKLGDKLKTVVIYFSVVLAMFLSVGLFFLLPMLIGEGISYFFKNSPEATIAAARSAAESVSRIVIFLAYLLLCTLQKDVRRVFEYHGAEHKTIACYEAGEELTPENVKKHLRYHPRCGTSFLLFVMIISIIVYAFLPRFDEYGKIAAILLRMGTRLLCLPIVAGLSYEVIKWAGRSKNKIVGLLSKPGLWLQKLTTREPDTSQIEVAIESMKPCIPENKEEDKW